MTPAPQRARPELIWILRKRSRETTQPPCGTRAPARPCLLRRRSEEFVLWRTVLYDFAQFFEIGGEKDAVGSSTIAGGIVKIGFDVQKRRSHIQDIAQQQPENLNTDRKDLAIVERLKATEASPLHNAVGRACGDANHSVCLLCGTRTGDRAVPWSLSHWQFRWVNGRFKYLGPSCV